MAYSPSNPPPATSPWVVREFARVRDALVEFERLRLQSLAAEPPRPRPGDLAYADGTNWNPNGTGEGIYWFEGSGWFRLATGAGIPLVDGDKGDLTVSSVGTVWTIDNDAVTYAKIQNVSATDKILGRASSGAGNIEEIDCTSAGRALLDDANAAAQRSTLGLGSAAVADTGDFEAAGSIAIHEAATDPHPDLIDDLTAATSVALTDQVMVTQSGTNKRATVEQVRDIVFGDDWTDLVIPAVGINPAGAAAPPTLNNATGCLEFSATADNVIIITWQMPHGWSGHYDATKGIVVPHLHVRFLTSTAAPNNVSRWKCEYDVADPFGNFTNAYGTYTAMATVSVTNPANTAQCGLIDLGDLDLGAYGASCILHAKISRLAASDAADLDTSVIALYSADLHYQTRTAGSENEVPS